MIHVFIIAANAMFRLEVCIIQCMREERDIPVLYRLVAAIIIIYIYIYLFI